MKKTNNYETIRIAKLLIELGETYLKNIRHASYGFDRVYNDGTCFRLSTSPETLLYLEENKNMITAPVPDFLLKKDKFHYIVPDQIAELKPQYLEFKTKFNVKGVLNSIEKKPGYYDQFWFHSSENLHSLSNILVNNIEEVQKFFSIFKDKTTELIQIAAKDFRHPLDSSRISNITGLTSEKSQNRFDSPVQFSKKEIECIAFITIGLTIPEMSVFMSLSPRTVEYYINNVKSKLGCFRKSEVVTQIKRLNLDSLYETEFKAVIQRYLSQANKNLFD